jgi:hypothetical protein
MITPWRATPVGPRDGDDTSGTAPLKPFDIWYRV